MTEWTHTRDPYDVMMALQAAGVPAGVVQHAGDKQERDPQLRARDFYPTIDHPELGRHAFEGMPVTASRTPWRLRMASPQMGADRETVCADLLGLPLERVAELIADAAL
ncbi:MAG: CoA transferase [Dehalococcoidia bacterium]